MTNPVNIRVDKNDRDCAKVVLDAIGMDVNTAVTIYLREIVRSGGIPFHLRADVPNAETIKAIQEAENGELHGPYDTVEQLMEALNAED